MPQSFPALEAVNGHGFEHEIFIKDTQPRELVANVQGDPDLWPMAQLFAASPRLLSACQAAHAILNEVHDEYDWDPDEEMRLTSALAEASAAITAAGHSMAVRQIPVSIADAA
jgi:hypothetical protein